MVTLALLGYVVLAGTVGARLLQGQLWMQAAPIQGARVWTGFALSLPLALLAAALNLLASTTVGHTVGDLVHACVVVLRRAFVGPVSTTGSEVASLALVAIVLHTLVAYAADVATAYRARQRYRAQAFLLGTGRAYRGAVRGEHVRILQHPLPFAFCLPGRARTIILSSSALGRLNQSELQAVLGHERAHLRRLDHLTVSLSRAVARGLWFLPGLRLVASEHQQLVEMVADDYAAQHTSPRAVAAALIQLVNVPPATSGTHRGRASSPSSASSSLDSVGGVGVAEGRVAARVARQLHPGPPRSRIAVSCRGLAVVLIAALPALLVSVVWVAAASAATCPID